MIRLLVIISVVTTSIQGLHVYGSSSIQGRLFNNPILGEGDYSDPGAIKINSTYYIVTSTKFNQIGKLPIYVSSDLSSWKQTGHIFDNSNIPRWSSKQLPFLTPRIHKVGTNYLVYFTATDSTTNMLSIGVAVAPHPEGPYTATDRPLLSDPSAHLQDSSIIDDNGNLYLMWVDQNVVKGRMLNSNGLSFYATHCTKLLGDTSEATNISGPGYTQREKYHYLMYSKYTNENQSLQVARSLYPLGPYELHNTAFLDSNELYKGPSHATLVKDFNDKNDVIVFDAFRKGEMGLAWPRVTLLASVSWVNIDQRYRFNYQNASWPSVLVF